MKKLYIYEFIVIITILYIFTPNLYIAYELSEQNNLYNRSLNSNKLKQNNGDLGSLNGMNNNGLGFNMGNNMLNSKLVNSFLTKI